MKTEHTLDLSSFEKLLKDIIDQDGMWADDTPCYFLSGSGFDWFYRPAGGGMCRLARGTDLYPLQPDPDDNGMLPCLYNSEVFLIPYGEVLNVGWN